MGWCIAKRQTKNGTRQINPTYGTARLKIAPMLTVIFAQSLNFNNLLEDWLTVNITPVFNEEDRGNPVNYQPIS